MEKAQIPSKGKKTEEEMTIKEKLKKTVELDAFSSSLVPEGKIALTILIDDEGQSRYEIKREHPKALHFVRGSSRIFFASDPMVEVEEGFLSRTFEAVE